MSKGRGSGHEEMTSLKVKICLLPGLQARTCEGSSTHSPLFTPSVQARTCEGSGTHSPLVIVDKWCNGNAVFLSVYV